MVLFYDLSSSKFPEFNKFSKYKVFQGDDKHENENLIKYGFPEDVWFHVDKLSSAHVYLRMPCDDEPLNKEKLKQMMDEGNGGGGNVVVPYMPSVPKDAVVVSGNITIPEDTPTTQI